MILESGTLDSRLTIVVDAQEPFSLTGDVELANLVLRDEVLGENLLSLPYLGMDNIEYSTGTNSAEISEVSMNGMSVMVIINADGSSNISRSLNASSSQEAPQAESSPSGPAALPDILLGRILLENVGAEFTDRNLPFEFNASIQELNGSIENISNTSSVPATIALEGRVGDFGLMAMNSTLAPFDISENALVDLRFSNIDLPSATPYVIKFAGREVDDGAIDLTLDYSLMTGTLEANNGLVLRDLRLGDSIAHPGAIDLPLDLALALLKDSNGVIDLEIPVTGQVNDPEFDFSPAIRTAIANVFTNIVAAPFRLHGNLIGAGDVELDHIRFRPGRADIAPPEREVLLMLGEALEQRPELRLQFPVMHGGEADITALQTLAVDTRVERLVSEINDDALSLLERRNLVMENLYEQGMLPPSLDMLRAEIILASSLQDPDTETLDETAVEAVSDPAELDLIAYNSILRERLIRAEVIADADLVNLGTARTGSIIKALEEAGTGSDVLQRLQVGETVISESDEEGWFRLDFDLQAR